MKILIVILSVFVPLIMYFLQRKYPHLQRIYHIMALIALLVFGNLAALQVYEVIIEDAVYSFQIHSIFLNPLFMISGAYLGVYVIYLLLIFSLHSDL